MSFHVGFGRVSRLFPQTVRTPRLRENAGLKAFQSICRAFNGLQRS